MPILSFLGVQNPKIALVCPKVVIYKDISIFLVF